MRPFLMLNERAGSPVPQRMFEEAGVDLARLHDTQARVPWSTIDRLCALTAPLGGIEAVGPLAAELLQDDSLDIPEYAVRHQQTLADGFAALVRYMPLIADGARWHTRPVHGQLRICFSVEGVSAYRGVEGYALACLVVLTSRFTGRKPNLVRAELAYPRPRTTEHYERVFGCPLDFDCFESALTVPQDAMRVPMIHRDSALSKTLERMVEQLLQSHGTLPSTRDRVQALIVELLPRGECSAVRVADQLQTPLRTLRRHLKSEGTTFRDLVEDTRRALATRYLRDTGLAVSEVAYLLGFSTVQAFDRAFRRWYDQTPLQWRGEHALRRRG